MAFMECCENCEKEIPNLDDGVYDAEQALWFCTFSCKGAYMARILGGRGAT